MKPAAISFPIFGESFVIDVPNYISVFGARIYLYGVMIALGFVLGGLYLMKRREAFGLTQDNVLDLIIISIPSAIVGARLYYIAFNAGDYFGAGKWLNIFKLREGGLAVYGGIILAVLAVFIYSKRKNISFYKLADAGGMGLLIGQAIGRWGNFFNREAFGVITEVPWRMGLTFSSGTYYVHPAFLYESLWNALGFLFLHLYSLRNRKRYDGQLFLFYLAWYGFGRYMIEGIRTDSLFLPGTDIRVSQLLAALTFSAAVVILIRNRVKDGSGGAEETAAPDTAVSADDTLS